MSKMLSLDRVSLRALEPTDLDFLYNWEMESEAWWSSNTLAPYSRQLLWQYLENYDADIYKTKSVRMIIMVDDEAVGAIDVFNFDPLNSRAEVGVFVVEKMRGEGIAAKALEIVKRYAKNRLALKQVYATMMSTNEVARNTFESVGFVVTAQWPDWFFTGEGYVDALMLQCAL